MSFHKRGSSWPAIRAPRSATAPAIRLIGKHGHALSRVDSPVKIGFFIEALILFARHIENAC